MGLNLNQNNQEICFYCEKMEEPKNMKRINRIDIIQINKSVHRQLICEAVTCILYFTVHQHHM